MRLFPGYRWLRSILFVAMFAFKQKMPGRLNGKSRVSAGEISTPMKGMKKIVAKKSNGIEI